MSTRYDVDAFASFLQRLYIDQEMVKSVPLQSAEQDIRAAEEDRHSDATLVSSTQVVSFG